jgi:uncharacterized membrane protein
MRASANRYFDLILATIIYALLAFLSALAFLVPAIWVLAWFSLVQYIIVDKKIGPIAALRYSKQLTANHKGKVWGLIGASFLLGFMAVLLRLIPEVGLLLYYVASGVIGVATSVAFAGLYRWLEYSK